MHDLTIPFYNTILKCEEYEIFSRDLPEGYRIVPYRPGYEKNWARLEFEEGDFENETEAADYFRAKYLRDSCREDLLFLLEPTGEVIGSCIAWTDDRKGSPVNSLHWLIVDERYRGKKLGRALCIAVMDRFAQKGGGPVYIHTQPWSWKAILLYASLGFRLQKSDTFGTYINRYPEAMETLKRILSEEQIERLEEEAEI